MAEENKGLTKGLLIGFIAGGVAGAIAALLYAPKSGRELRADIKRKASNLAEEASDYVHAARTKTKDIINEGKERSDQLIAETREKAENILGGAEKVLSGIRDRAQEEPGRVKSAFRAGVDAYKAEKDRSRS